MRIAQFISITILIAASAIIGCGPAEEGTIETDTATSALCESQCDVDLNACLEYCNNTFHPYWDEAYYRQCTDNCYWSYDSCFNAVYVLGGPTMLICHVDPDWHWNGIEVEIYTADYYIDSTCPTGQVYYRKRRIDTVGCDYWQSQSSCQDDVEERIVNTWIPQGYIPITADDDDHCPNPRL